jgi:hypothetical protein
MTPAALEVPWHQKRVDLALTSRTLGLVTVELKVAKWRRAIDQAYVNRWASSASWVALWHECITLDTYAYASEAGVGLIAVTANTVYPLASPQPSPRPSGAERLSEVVENAGLRVRDLLSDAKGIRVALD